MIEPTAVLYTADPAPAVAVVRPPELADAPVTWRLVTEDGAESTGEDAGPMASFAPLAAGYHHATIAVDDRVAVATLLVRPQRAYLPDALARGDRTWGFACNLYALRSQRNWGIGDFTDLAAFFAFARSRRADAVGVNPLHALHYVDAGAASPYSPTSRFYLNPFYIDVEAVPEFARSAAATLAREPAFAATLAALRATAHVDYAAVAACKRPAFDALFDELLRLDPGHERRAAFAAFAAAGGERLERFATYEVLTERFALEDGRVRGWLTWPHEYRQPEGPAVAAFARGERRRIDFFKYLQFVADEQLAAAVAETASMRIGLYGDLAVGVDLNSADVWAHQERYVLDETVGAPPDPLAWQGQNWGLPPLDVTALRREGCATYAELLHANTVHAGALRIDHVMSLLRLFRIPAGSAPSEGTYVTYPFEELLATVAIESARTQCLIVGEDLGTVPDGFRDRMEREHVLSYRLLLFERDEAGGFRPPHAYPDLSLATATTHDLPPLPGWIVGTDIDLRHRFGLLDHDGAARERAERRGEASALLAALRAAGELDGGAFQHLHDALDTGTFDVRERAMLVAAAYRFLAATPARFVLVQLDDALGETEQVNVPGTFSEYPNWRRKVGVELEELPADDRLTDLAAAMNARVKGD